MQSTSICLVILAIHEHMKVTLAILVADILTSLPNTHFTSKIVDRCIIVMDRAKEGRTDDSGYGHRHL
jgi:hypothetical protein